MDADSIRARIEGLKAEKAQLMKQYDSEQADNALGAQMLRAGDDGAMYKFLRGQRDTRAMAEAQKANANRPTQDQFDRTLEALQATEAQMAGANVDPAQAEKMKLLSENQRSQLEDMLAKNPSLSRRNYGTAPKNEEPPADNLWTFKSELGYDGGSMTDEEIDARAEALRKANPNVNGDDVAKLVEEAKKRNETAYQGYVQSIRRDNALIKTLYSLYQGANDETRKNLRNEIARLGGKVNSNGELSVKERKPKAKADWIKNKR